MHQRLSKSQLTFFSWLPLNNSIKFPQMHWARTPNTTHSSTQTTKLPKLSLKFPRKFCCHRSCRSWRSLKSWAKLLSTLLLLFDSIKYKSIKDNEVNTNRLTFAWISSSVGCSGISFSRLSLAHSSEMARSVILHNSLWVANVASSSGSSDILTLQNWRQSYRTFTCFYYIYTDATNFLET